LVGDGAAPFEAAVEPFTTEGGTPGIRWVARNLKPPIFQQAAELFAQGASVREVRKALGISHGEAGRLRLKAVAEGILESEPEDQAEEPEAAADGPFRLN
jgi:transposase-like protein